MKTNQKLWIIGDSFAAMRNGKLSWQYLLKERFVGKDLIISTRGGRDIQTIIEIYLKCLHIIADDDLVILMLPTTARVRYPITNPKICLDFGENLKMDKLNESVEDSFIAYHANSNYHSNIKKDLIHPLNVIPDTLIEDLYENEFDRETYYNEFELNYFLNNSSKFSYNQLSTIINTSKPVLDNYNKQFYSFSKAFKFKTLFLSWSYDFDTLGNDSNIIGRSELEKNMGELETLHALFLKSNGEDGIEGDFHWSKNADKKIYEYIVKNNSKYFN